MNSWTIGGVLGLAISAVLAAAIFGGMVGMIMSVNTRLKARGVGPRSRLACGVVVLVLSTFTWFLFYAWWIVREIIRRVRRPKLSESVVE
jgi:Kef-type K+ transport system membrane component KefB